MDLGHRYCKTATAQATGLESATRAAAAFCSSAAPDCNRSVCHCGDQRYNNLVRCPALSHPLKIGKSCGAEQSWFQSIEIRKAITRKDPILSDKYLPHLQISWFTRFFALPRGFFPCPTTPRPAPHPWFRCHYYKKWHILCVSLPKAYLEFSVVD